MTVNALHKMLTSLIADGNGRLPVWCDKSTLTHNLDPEVVIIEVCGLHTKHVLMMDEDGGIAVNKDGSERYKKAVVLFGPGGEPCCGYSSEACQCKERT